MTKMIVLALAGTGFPTTADPILQDFLDRLDSSQYETHVVPYPATYGGIEPSFAVSRAKGTEAMFEAIAELPEGTPIVLAGYSQGAVIAGDVARSIALANSAGQGPNYNLKACALIADGYRPQGIGLVPPGERARGVSEGYGIAGQRSVPFIPTWWVSAWGDPIASLPDGNPLRTVADMSEWYSFSDIGRWGADMLDKVIQGRLQDWWAPWKWSGWAGALAFTRGYLFDGRHTADYILHDYTRTLADRLNEFAITGS